MINNISKIISILPSPTSEIPSDVIEYISQQQSEEDGMDTPLTQSEFFENEVISASGVPNVITDFWEFNEVAGKQYLKFSIDAVFLIGMLSKSSADLILNYLYILSASKNYSIQNVDSKFLMNAVFPTGVFGENDSKVITEHINILLDEREWMLYLTDKPSEYEGEIVMVRFDGNNDIPFPREIVKEWSISGESKDEERIYFWNEGKFLSISLEDYAGLK